MIIRLTADRCSAVEEEEVAPAHLADIKRSLVERPEDGHGWWTRRAGDGDGVELPSGPLLTMQQLLAKGGCAPPPPPPFPPTPAGPPGTAAPGQGTPHTAWRTHGAPAQARGWLGADQGGLQGVQCRARECAARPSGGGAVQAESWRENTPSSSWRTG